MFSSEEQLVKGVASAFHILRTWHLNPEEIRGVLGFPFGTQLDEWQAGELDSMPADVVKRLSLVVSIYKLFRGYRVGAATLLRLPVPQFGNQTPLARMVSGDPLDLVNVHQYLKDHFRKRSPKPL